MKSLAVGIHPVATKQSAVRAAESNAPALANDRAAQALTDARRSTNNAQAEARANELEQVLEQIGDAVIVKDLNAVVTYWNREAAALYGFSRKEAVGQPMRKLHAADLSDADYNRLLDRIREGKPTAICTERRKKNGEIVRVELKTTPLLDADGNLIGEIPFHLSRVA